MGTFRNGFMLAIIVRQKEIHLGIFQVICARNVSTGHAANFLTLWTADRGKTWDRYLGLA